MSGPGTRLFPPSQVILAAVSEGTCPSCRQRLDPDEWGSTDPCSYELGGEPLAGGGCSRCNSRWEVNAVQWSHWPLDVNEAGQQWGACTCYGRRVDQVEVTP